MRSTSGAMPGRFTPSPLSEYTEGLVSPDRLPTPKPRELPPALGAFYLWRLAAHPVDPNQTPARAPARDSSTEVNRSCRHAGLRCSELQWPKRPSCEPLHRHGATARGHPPARPVECSTWRSLAPGSDPAKGRLNGSGSALELPAPGAISHPGGATPPQRFTPSPSSESARSTAPPSQDRAPRPRNRSPSVPGFLFGGRDSGFGIGDSGLADGCRGAARFPGAAAMTAPLEHTSKQAAACETSVVQSPTPNPQSPLPSHARGRR